MPGADTTIRANDGNSTLGCSPNIVCLHTIVGYAPASAAHFSTNAIGKIWQHRDTARQSAANYQGNSHIIAIENEDRGPAFGNWDINDGHDVPGFTAAQIESIAQICAWANKTHGIPLVQCPDSKPGSRGIAYHRQGISSPNNYAGYAYPGRVAGGEIWSTASGKVCPGDRRISQIPKIIERARQIVGGEDLDATQNKLLEELHQTVISGSYESFHNGQSAKLNKDLRTVITEITGGLQAQVNTLAVKLDQLSTKLDSVGTPDVDEVALATALHALGLGQDLTVDQVEQAVRDAMRNQWNK